MGAGVPEAARRGEAAAEKKEEAPPQEGKKKEGPAAQVNELEAGFLVLNIKEQIQIESIAETFIPTDENGPGAKEAGVIYFIDRQLATGYGYNGNMYMQGPFVMPNQKGELIIGGIKYPQGSAPTRLESGARYQYPMLLRYFWRQGLQALDEYSKNTYGDSFEKLSKGKKIQVLTDIYDNKPANFNNIVPQDFFYELFFMTWSGFLMDPLYGGNKNKVGWEYTGFAGLACAKDVNEAMALMVANKPTRLEPVSLAEYQRFLRGGT